MLPAGALLIVFGQYVLLSAVASLVAYLALGIGRWVWTRAGERLQVSRLDASIRDRVPSPQRANQFGAARTSTLRANRTTAIAIYAQTEANVIRLQQQTLRTAVGLCNQSVHDIAHIQGLATIAGATLHPTRVELQQRVLALLALARQTIRKYPYRLESPELIRPALVYEVLEPVCANCPYFQEMVPEPDAIQQCPLAQSMGIPLLGFDQKAS